MCVVSELPLFLMGSRSESIQDPISKRLRTDLEALRLAPTEEWETGLTAVIDQYQLSPTPLELQVRLQVGMIVLALGKLVRTS